MKKPQSCRHRRTWLLCGGHLEWCYECGALRKMQGKLGTNVTRPKTFWWKPAGVGGGNPIRLHALKEAK